MAATNYTPIQLYYSTTASAVPVNTNLASGELAINITDGKLYYKDNGGVVQVIATKGAGTIGGSNTQIQYNNAGALAGNAAMTFNSATSTVTLTTLNLTNALGATYGGTAQSSYTQGDILYSSATNTLSKLGIGTVNYILTSTGSVPQWVAPTSVTVQTANNLAGGAGGSVPYQSAADTTTFLAIGAANRVMTSSGTAPQWVTALTGLTGVSSSSITNTSLTSGRLVYSTTGGAQTDSSSLTFNGTTLSAGGFSTTGLSTLVKTVTIGDSNFSGTAVFAAATPAKLYIGTGTVTDTTSAIGATNATGAISSLAITPIAATNTSVTYTNASTLYIAGAPSAGTNVTLTNPYALYVAGGASYFGGAVTYGAGLTLGGNLLFSPDNTYDIGASGATRPRAIYVAGAGTYGTALTVSKSSTGTPPYLNLDNASSDGGVGTRIFLTNSGTSAKYNWVFGTQIVNNDALDFVPSTTLGGGTYSNPALSLTPGGAATIRDVLWVKGGGSTFGNGAASTSASAEITLDSGTATKYSDIDYSHGGVQKWRVGTNGTDNLQIYNFTNGAVATFDTSSNVTLLNNLNFGSAKSITWDSNYLYLQTRTASVPVVTLLQSASGGYAPRLDFKNGAGSATVISLDATSSNTSYFNSGKLVVGGTSASGRFTIYPVAPDGVGVNIALLSDPNATVMQSITMGNNVSGGVYGGGGTGVGVYDKTSNSGSGQTSVGFYYGAQYDGSNASGSTYALNKFGLYINDIYSFYGLNTTTGNTNWGLYVKGGGMNYIASYLAIGGVPDVTYNGLVQIRGNTNGQFDALTIQNNDNSSSGQSVRARWKTSNGGGAEQYKFGFIDYTAISNYGEQGRFSIGVANTINVTPVATMYVDGAGVRVKTTAQVDQLTVQGNIAYAQSGANWNHIKSVQQNNAAQNTWYTVDSWGTYEAVAFLLMISYEYDAGDGSDMFALFIPTGTTYGGGVTLTRLGGATGIEVQMSGGTTLQMRQTAQANSTGILRATWIRMDGNG